MQSISEVNSHLKLHLWEVYNKTSTTICAKYEGERSMPMLYESIWKFCRYRLSGTCVKQDTDYKDMLDYRLKWPVQ